METDVACVSESLREQMVRVKTAERRTGSDVTRRLTATSQLV